MYINTFKFSLIICILLLIPIRAIALEFQWVGCGITKKAFMASLAEAYQKKTGIKINLSGGGATKGIRDVARKTASLGGTCRYVLPGEIKEQGVKLVPMAWDALVVLVHPTNPVNSVSMDELRDIFLGKYTNWSELKGKNAPIELFVRQGKISGVGRTLRELLFNDVHIEFDAATKIYPSSGPLEKAVEKAPNAIAVSGISSARKRQVKLLKLEGKDSSYENIRNGNYLLYRPLYLVMNPSVPDYIKIKEFADFANSKEGRDVIRANSVVPYLEAPKLILKQIQQGNF